MARLPGDPGVIGWLKFSAGFRLPDANLDWVTARADRRGLARPHGAAAPGA